MFLTLNQALKESPLIGPVGSRDSNAHKDNTMSNEEIKKEAEELNVGFYANHGIIDLDGVNGLAGTFTGDNAKQEASEWLEMYRGYLEDTRKS